MEENCNNKERLWYSALTLWGVLDYVIVVLVPVLYRSASYYLLHLAVTLLLVVIAFAAKGSIQSKKAPLVLLAMVLLCINALYYNFTGLGGIVSAFTFVLLYSLFPRYVVNDKILKIVICLIVFSLMTFPFLGHGEINKNKLGQFVFSSSILIIPLIKGKKQQFFFWGLMAYSILNTLQWNCRSILGASALYILLSLIPYKILSNKKIFIITIISFVAIELIYPYVYIKFDEFSFYDRLNEISQDVSEKSLFSGREWMWQAILDGLNANPIIGLGTHTTIIDDGNINTHNSMLNMYGLYGYPFGLICTALILMALYPLRTFLFIKEVKYCYVGYLTLLFIGINEVNVTLSECFSSAFILVIAYTYINKYKLYGLAYK